MPPSRTLSRRQLSLKRAFDFIGALAGLVATCWIIFPAWIAVTIDTRASGFFRQARVGRRGKIFRVVKLRTMRVAPDYHTTVTTGRDPRITTLGRFLRRTKIDELPQLWNVLIGDMSFVGPRPDVPGYADRLEGADRMILSVRPGITGPASIYFRDEEAFLGRCRDAEQFNDRVLWPAKVAINNAYLDNYSFFEDMRLIADTVWPTLYLSRASRDRLQAKESGTGIFADEPSNR